MSAALAFIVLKFAVLIGFGLWQVVSVNREIARDRAKAAAAAPTPLAAREEARRAAARAR